MLLDTQIKGHTHTRAALRASIVADRVHHAWLLTGPQGIGKRQIAMAFARALNCTGDRPSPGAPCEHCTHCVRIRDHLHPDVTLVEPDRTKARAIIKISTVRELVRTVNYKPFEAHRRVIVIDDAESMAEEAANAMLKTLEEPTGDTIFILVTAHPRRLLATIRSRCQAVRFAPLDRPEVEALLIDTGIEPARAALLAAFGHGSIGAAMAMSTEGALEDRLGIIESVTSLERGDVLGVFKLAGLLAKTGAAEIQARLDALKTFYRDVVLIRSGASPERIINIDLRATIEAEAQDLTVEAAIGHIERIDAVQSSIRAYVDPNLLLEDLFFSLASRR